MDGRDGLCGQAPGKQQNGLHSELSYKRLEQGVFLWPPSLNAGETLSLTSAQLSLLIEGVDWRAPEQRWRPAVAG